MRISHIFTVLVFSLLMTQLAGAQPQSSAADSSIDDGSYPFRPGDAVRITVFPDTTAIPSGTYHIDDDGLIVLPIVGKTYVAALTVRGLTNLIKRQYVNFQRVPNATVRPLIRAGAVGGFHTPGLVYIDPDMSLWDIVRLAGGPVREDGLKKIKWMRGDSIIAQSIGGYLRSGESLERIGFRSGDQLSVTAEPLQTAGQVFVGTVLPILSFIITTGLAALTLVQVYK